MMGIRTSIAEVFINFRFNMSAPFLPLSSIPFTYTYNILGTIIINLELPIIYLVIGSTHPRALRSVLRCQSEPSRLQTLPVY